MSDALTDIARDQYRAEEFRKYLDSLLLFLNSPSNETRKAVIEQAKLVDSIHGGYWGGSTSISRGIEKFLDGLVARDHSAWAKLLWCCLDHYGYGVKFRKLSPFGEHQLLTFVDYRYGWDVKLEGDLKNFFAKSICLADMTTGDGDLYMVVVDAPAAREVCWVQNRSPDIKKPRSPKKK